MQAIRQMSKGKGGLRFWNRALGIEANRDTPHTRQPLTGVTLWGCVVGMALVLMGQVAWAHDTDPATNHTHHYPTCRTSNLFVEEMDGVTKEDEQRYIIPIHRDSEATVDLSDGFSVTPDANDLVTQSDTRPTQADPTQTETTANRGILKMTIPTNTAGMLSVVTTQGVNGGALCRGGTRIAEFGYTITTATDAQRTYAAPTVFTLTARVMAGDEVYAVLSSGLSTQAAADGDPTVPSVTTVGAITPSTITVSFTGVMPDDDTAAQNEITASKKGAVQKVSHAFRLVVADETTGLLTVETTGNTDTVGTLAVGATGSRTELVKANPAGNFLMQVPVQRTSANAGIYTVTVEGRGETDETRAAGAYGLVVNFFTAATRIGTADLDATEVTLPADLEADPLTLQSLEGGADGYYWFTLVAGTATAPLVRDLMVSAAMDSMTAGTLYAPLNMDPAEDAPSGNAGFKINTLAYLEGIGDPRAFDIHTRLYILKVTARGSAEREFSLAVKPSAFVASHTVDMSGLPTPVHTERTLAANDDDGDVHLFNVKNEGVLSVESALTDPAGTLADPKGSFMRYGDTMPIEDDDDGTDKNFLIVQDVSPGFYVLRVSSYDAAEGGTYTLKTVFMRSIMEARVVTKVPEDNADLMAACTDRIGYVELTQASCEEAGWGFPETRTVTVGGGGGGTRTVPPSASSCRSFITAAVDDYK